MEALGQIALKGDQHSIAAASALLEDEDAEVRFSAVEALGQIAETEEDVAHIAKRRRT